jgi:AhpD family alkylhydroperoxidase
MLHLEFDELDEDLKSKLGSRVERLGYLGEFFQVGAVQPTALGHFIEFTEALKDALPAREVEVIALTVSTRTGNDYERVQHEQLARRIGMTDSEIEALGRGHITAAQGFSEAECAVADLAQAVVAAGGKGCPSAYQRVREVTDDASAVALLMMSARYVAHSAISCTWCLEPPVPSIFDATDS